MANPNNILGISNPNGTVGVSIGTDPAGSNYAFSEGISSGFAIQPTNPAGMSVSVGGVAGVVDSALVKSTSGIVFPVANHSGQPVELEIPAAPSANSRIDAIVLSVDTSVTVSELNGADSVSIDVVEGDSAASPLAPDDAAIRASIPNGSSAAYIILGLVNVTSSTSVITDAEITQGNYSTLKSHNIDSETYYWYYTNTNRPKATSSSYTQMSFSPKVQFNMPTEVGQWYRVAVHCTLKTSQDTSQTILTPWIDGVRSPYNASGTHTTSGWWMDGEWTVGIVKATKPISTIEIKGAASGTNTQIELVNNIMVTVTKCNLLGGIS